MDGTFGRPVFDLRGHSLGVLAGLPAALRTRLGGLTTTQSVQDLDSGFGGQVLVKVIVDLDHCGNHSEVASVCAGRGEGPTWMLYGKNLLGALLQAPRHSTSIRVNFPSLVVSPFFNPPK